MNREQMNEWRTAHGLAPIVLSPEAEALARARKRAQQANKAKRAQDARDLKAKRSKGGK